MIFLALTAYWFGAFVAGLVFFILFAIVLATLLRYFQPGYSPMAWSLGMMTEPVIRPFRRLVRPLNVPFDIAPWLAAGTLFLLRFVLLRLTAIIGFGLLGGRFPTASPLAAQLIWVPRAVLYAYMMVVFVRIMITWAGRPVFHPFVRFLSRLVDPVLYYIRGLLPSGPGAVDWSPLVLIAGLTFIDQVFLSWLVLGF